MKLQTFITALLVTGAAIAIFFVVYHHFKKPEPDRTISLPQQKVPLGFLEGNKDASLTIYNFFDYSCQYCKQYAEHLTILLKQYNNEFSVIHVPLPFGSYQAAAISVCEYSTLANLTAHHYFYKHQETLQEALNHNLSDILSQNNRDEVQSVQTCLNNSLYEKWIDTNRSIAQQTGISSVPVLLIENDIYIGAYPERQLRSLINFHLYR